MAHGSPTTPHNTKHDPPEYTYRWTSLIKLQESRTKTENQTKLQVLLFTTSSMQHLQKASSWNKTLKTTKPKTQGNKNIKSDKIKQESHVVFKARAYKWVCGCILKVDSQKASLMCKCKVFQSLEPATTKVLSRLSFCLDLRGSRRRWSADLRHRAGN